MSKEGVFEKEEVELGMGNFLDTSGDLLHPTCLSILAWQLSHGWTGNDLCDRQLEEAAKAASEKESSEILLFPGFHTTNLQASRWQLK